METGMRSGSKSRSRPFSRSSISTKSTVKLLHNRSIDGLCFHNPSLRFFRETISHSQSLYKRDLSGHFGCVNAIEFSSNGDFIASGGDDRRLLIWNIWKTVFDSKIPWVIDTQHLSNINSCSFDNTSKTVATGGNDGRVIVHDIATLKSTCEFSLSEAVFCLSPDPVNSTIIATATDDGKVEIIDTRMSSDSRPFTLANLRSAMHSVMYNPTEPRILATANSKKGVAIWDIRRPKKSLFYKSGIQNCMSVRFNNRGNQLLVLRRRGSPVLYDVKKMHPICKFDYKTYYNACTLKSASFAGTQDEYVMSGSDDFCVYLWKVPNSPNTPYLNAEPHIILKGHRSIVNQVRYCAYNQMIISSGVEKVIKMWTPYSLPGSTGHLNHSRRYGDDDELERNAYSHEEYINMVLRAGSFMNHDYSNGNTEEEPCMIAFFDSLIQREVEQNGDDSDFSTDSDNGSVVKKECKKYKQNFSESDDEENDTVSTAQVESPTAEEGQTATTLSDVVRERLAANNDDSSDDSAGEVDGILSAMYNMYMQSRNQNSNSGPSGRKISSVIAQRKYKDKTSKLRSNRKHESQPPREDRRPTDGLHENGGNAAIIGDILDTYVNTLATRQSRDQISSGTSDERVINHRSNLHSPSSPPLLPSVNPPGRSTINSHFSGHHLPTVPLLHNVTNDSNVDRNQASFSGDIDIYFEPELDAFSSRLSMSSSESESERSDKNISTSQDKVSVTMQPFGQSKSKTVSFSNNSSNLDGQTTSKSASVVNNKEDKKTYKLSPRKCYSSTKSDVSRKFNDKGKGNVSLMRKGRLQDCTSTLLSSSSSSSSDSSTQNLPQQSSSHHHTSLKHHSDTSCSFEIKEKKPLFKDELDEVAHGDAERCDKKKTVTFKQIKKSKGRKFRKRKQTDSCSSSDEEDG